LKKETTKGVKGVKIKMRIDLFKEKKSKAWEKISTRKCKMWKAKKGKGDGDETEQEQ
jgi:hypothetical protein